MAGHPATGLARRSVAWRGLISMEVADRPVATGLRRVPARFSRDRILLVRGCDDESEWDDESRSGRSDGSRNSPLRRANRQLPVGDTQRVDFDAF